MTQLEVAASVYLIFQKKKIFAFIFSSLLLLFLLFHLLLSFLVSTLSSSRSFSFLVFSFLVLSPFLGLSLSVSLFVFLCGVVCCVVLCVSLWSWCVFGVCVCVLRHAEKVKNPYVASKTPPCVHARHPRVCRHHAHMCFNMCAWSRYTRGRFEWTHGVTRGHSQFCLPKFAHVWLSRASQVHRRNFWIFPIFKLEE